MPLLSGKYYSLEHTAGKPFSIFAQILQIPHNYKRLNEQHRAYPMSGLLILPDYNESELMNWIESREWMAHIEDVEYFKSLPSIFSRFGVGLVFVPSLPKTVYGAIRWIENKPLIQISDRGHDLISCWFTLFHEFGHAIKHKNVEIYEGEINESKAKQNKREKEANKFANEYLFNGDNLRKAEFDRKRAGLPMTANLLAEEFNVRPIFASYWLLKAQYAPAFQRRIQIDFVSQYQ